MPLPIQENKVSQETEKLVKENYDNNNQDSNPYDKKAAEIKSKNKVDMSATQKSMFNADNKKTSKTNITNNTNNVTKPNQSIYLSL